MEGGSGGRIRQVAGKSKRRKQEQEVMRFLRLLWAQLGGGGWGRIMRGALGQEVDSLVG